MVDIRPITAAETDLYRKNVSLAFGRDPDTDEASARRFEAIFEMERTLAVFDGDDIVGTCAAFSLEVTAPGGAPVRMGGTTVVTVRPTHRRQGLLRGMMEVHLDEVADRGEPLAGLWSSEGAIYGRFGYGPATYHHDTRIDGRAVTFRRRLSDEGSVRLVDAAEAEPIVRSLFERARKSRTGMLSRSQGWWEHRVLADPEAWRRGRTAHRYAIYENDGQVDGYVTYRQKGDWEGSLPQGEVAVTELIALTPDAHHGLWHHLTNIDLFPRVSYWNLPVDDSLPLMLEDPRAVTRSVEDALWIRLIDIPAALEARQYERGGSVVFSVRDQARPATGGTFALCVDSGAATCERTDAEPTLEFDVDALGSLYLGGGNALALAAAGRITGVPESIATLHRLMGTDTAPWCPEVF